MTKISVILCTHNPRQEYISEVLSGLQVQSLAMDQWELILIDNASQPWLAGRLDVSWHPSGRIVVEESLGLTAARLRGIHEAKFDVLLFVDDDNVLDKSYLETVGKISCGFSQIGAWSGELVGRFEAEPAAPLRPYLPRLALRKVSCDAWFNAPDVLQPKCLTLVLPWGAGLCVRRDVAEAYLKQLESSPARRLLDRRGKSLDSAGDLDLVMTAFDLGYGCGLFKDLRVTHLIPAVRVTEEYLLRMTESQEYSVMMLRGLRGDKIEVPTARPTLAMRLRSIRRAYRSDPLYLRFERAIHAGHERAYRELGLRGTKGG